MNDLLKNLAILTTIEKILTAGGADSDRVTDALTEIRSKIATVKAETEKFEKLMAPRPRPFMSTSDLALEASERDRGERDPRDWFYGVRMM